MINEIVTGLGLAKKGYDYLSVSDSEIDKLIEQQAAKRTVKMAKFDNGMARRELAELLKSLKEGTDWKLLGVSTVVGGIGGRVVKHRFG